ncbi:hypothetical protein C1N81_25740 [Streptomyces sp. SGAir0957]
MPDDPDGVAGHCGMFVPLYISVGVPGPDSWLDQCHGRVRSRSRARHDVAIPTTPERTNLNGSDV